ncbi:integrase [Shewanella baltica]|uniref:tyrosine-type recombinase/integrase n=1 Tax=Shewanella TaxID=22 RepID=UPI0007B49C89|nr:tyrosine-type recombinase/integrase [Shewanella baltica]KZK70365.1 integrase [Shewanella baltica]
MSNLPKGVEKLPVGVEINFNTVRIVFMLNGKRYREPLKGYSKITKSVIKYAENKRNTILTEIAENRFDYIAHFPESIKAMEFAGILIERRNVANGVNHWLKIQDVTKAKSTSKNYRSKSKHVINYFGGDQLISEISRSHLLMFQANMLKAGLSPKTVNDVFTIVRGVWYVAFEDGIIRSNPLDRISNIERDTLEETADPFTRDELERIAADDTSRRGDINMIMFCCWSGLSLSEVIALAWEDIDTVNWTVNIRRARVLTQYKVPKERGRVRVIELIDPAKEWLIEQMQHTMMLPTIELEVKQRDNITTKNENIRFVFLNGKSGLPWYDHSVRRWFTGILERTKLRHRGPNQCRHTFASQLLSNYVPLEWVARQLGHSDTTMIKKHYGKWIPKDSQKMANRVSEMLGFTKDTEGEQNGDFAQLLPRCNKGNQ